MRVLHVMECTIGGTRRHLVDAAAGQRLIGIDVAIAVSTLRDPDFERDLARLEGLGVRVHRVPMVRSLSPRADARDLSALRGVLRREDPDVVHTHSSKGGALGRLASVLEDRGARVHTPHTFAFLFGAMFSGPKRALFRAIEQGLCGHTARVIAVSPSEGRTIGESGVVERSRIRVVPNGIDPTIWLAAEPAARSELADDPRAPIALVVGLLNAAKGQDLLLEALAEPGLERLRVAFAGSGEEEARLRALARARRVDDRVRFLGFRHDVPRLLSAADLLVLPSRWEGMPYAVLEAMAAAKPVVATPVDGARDLVESGVTGELASDISASALARALRTQLARVPDESRAQGAEARTRVLARHTAAAMVDGLAAVYREA
ncbi:MAG: glycosyltransferase [Planctomycetota bacterium]|nr:glycosyltransferase [Planctomycetota bacterium]